MFFSVDDLLSFSSHSSKIHMHALLSIFICFLVLLFLFFANE